MTTILTRTRALGTAIAVVLGAWLMQATSTSAQNPTPTASPSLAAPADVSATVFKEEFDSPPRFRVTWTSAAAEGAFEVTRVLVQPGGTRGAAEVAGSVPVVAGQVSYTFEEPAGAFPAACFTVRLVVGTARGAPSAEVCTPVPPTSSPGAPNTGSGLAEERSAAIAIGFAFVLVGLLAAAASRRRA